MLFAIGDLHLSLGVDKPMSIFGDNWINHHEKIKEDWLKRVGKDDTVLILGDTSWASKLQDAMADLDFINELPGRKIFIKGNHDYWWPTVGKLNRLYDNMFFLGTDFYTYKDYGICGARGWICPGDSVFEEKDLSIYNREVHRLELSLKSLRDAGYDKMIAMLHYPPTNDRHEDSAFTELFEKYGVELVLYGHLHGKDAFPVGFQGERRGVMYRLASCDYLDFKLLSVDDICMAD